jgi:hypothetical protein
MARALVRRFDELVRRILGVVEFTSDPDCLLRIRLARLPHPVEIGRARLPAGAPYVEIHLWNEHLPAMPQTGPDFPWAARSARLFVHSMRLLATHLASEPALADSRAVGGTAVLADDPSSIALLRRLGFAVADAPTALGAFWKDAYSRALIWTFNPASSAGGRRLRRSEIWMTMESFLARYGSTTAGEVGGDSRAGG